MEKKLNLTLRRFKLYLKERMSLLMLKVKESEKAVKILGGKIKDIVYFQLPGSEIERSLVVIEKVSKTPSRYPRKAGTPLKEPLGTTAK